MFPRCSWCAGERAAARTVVVAAGVAWALFFGSSRPARANAPAPFVRAPRNMGGAFIVGTTPLMVEHERLSFDCRAPSGCSFRAVYQVVNPGDAREEVLGAFYGIAASGVSIAADGADARRELTEEQLKACDAAVAAIDAEVLSSGPVARTGFTLGVAAHGHAELVFAGQMEPVYVESGRTEGGFVIAPLAARHPWLSTEPRDDAAIEYAYALSPIRGWARSASIDIAVRYRHGWRWSTEGPAWLLAGDDDGEVARTTLAARDAPVLHFKLVRPGITLENGGPFLAAGGRVGPAELRTRLGYEVGLPDPVIASAAVEASFHGRTSLVPLVELASPDVLIFIPSLGFGAGVPVQVRSGEPPLVGARLQLTVSFPVVSLVVPVDWFPGGAGSERTQIAFLGQASF